MHFVRTVFFCFAAMVGLASATPNRAIEFDGSNDYINLTGLPDLGINSVRTVEAWINPISCVPDGIAYRVIYADGANMLFCENYRLRWQSTSNDYNTISTND